LACVPDLVADGTVVVGVDDGDFHRGVSDVQAVAGRDVEQVPVLLLPIQQTAHVHLPLPLNQSQAKHAPRVSPWKMKQLRGLRSQDRVEHGLDTTETK